MASWILKGPIPLNIEAVWLYIRNGLNTEWILETFWHFWKLAFCLWLWSNADRSRSFVSLEDKHLFKVQHLDVGSGGNRSDFIRSSVYDPNNKWNNIAIKATTGRREKSRPVGLSGTYFSSNERQDVHLPRLALLDRGDDEAGAAQNDLPPGPAVDRQLELPLADVVRPGQLDPLGALDALGLPCKKEEETL